MNKIDKLLIACDFDGNLVKHAYPEIGEEIPNAFETLKNLQKDGHALILWTCRADLKDRKYLSEAVAYCKERGLIFDAINCNLPGIIKAWGNYDTRKIVADIYIDDKALNSTVGWSTINELYKSRSNGI